MAELAAQEALLHTGSVVALDAGAAAMAADLYRKIAKPRGREIDPAITACALTQGAALWTLKPSDFADVPGLTLV